MGVKTCLCRNQKISNALVNFEAKNIKTKFIACELSVKLVVTFGVVLYRNQ